MLEFFRRLPGAFSYVRSGDFPRGSYGWVRRHGSEFSGGDPLSVFNGWAWDRRYREALRNPTVRRARQVVAAGVSGAVVEHLRLAGGNSRVGRRLVGLLTRRPWGGSLVSSRAWLTGVVTNMMFRGFAWIRPVFGAGGELVRLEELVLEGSWDLGYLRGSGSRRALRLGEEVPFVGEDGAGVSLPLGDVVYAPLVQDGGGARGLVLPDAPLAALADVLVMSSAYIGFQTGLLRSNENPWETHGLEGGVPRGRGHKSGEAKVRGEDEALRERKAGDPLMIPSGRKLVKFGADSVSVGGGEARTHVIQSVADVWSLPAVLLGGTVDSRVASAYVEARRALYQGAIEPVVGALLDALSVSVLPAGERVTVSGFGSGRYEFLLDSVLAGLQGGVLDREGAAGALGVPVLESGGDGSEDD